MEQIIRAVDSRCIWLREWRLARAALFLSVLGVLAILMFGVAMARAATTTTAFASPGEYSFTVPAGVSNLTAVIVGAPGGACPGAHTTGGRAAAVTVSVAVNSGEQFFAGVGGPGGNCAPAAAGAGGIGGGANGGGAPTGYTGGAGGGGASVVGVASPSPGFPGLLVVAGAGGGAANLNSGPYVANGGASGSPGGAAGGRPGTLTAGGAAGGGCGCQYDGHPGSYGTGGAGASGTCTPGPYTDPDGAGGGGGGYYGGGGGAFCVLANGGGGGGSSFVSSTVTTVIAPNLTTAPPGVSFTYAAPTADESTTGLNFGVGTVGSADAEQTLTVTNNGSAPLLVSGVLLGGANPGDFLIGNRCQAAVAPGASCQVGVRFNPQATGARSATLSLLTNTAIAPPAVKLTGGQAGALRGAGSKRAGKVAVLSCKTAARRSGLGFTARAPTCTARVRSGSLKLTRTGVTTRATLARGRVTYATGTRLTTAHGQLRLVLNERRSLKPGTYTLTIRQRHGRRWRTRRELVDLV